MASNEAAATFWSKFPARGPPSSMDSKKVGGLPKAKGSASNSVRPHPRPPDDHTARYINVESLLPEGRAGLSRAQKAAKNIVQNRDVRYDINKMKWCSTICQETRRFWNGQKQIGRSSQARSGGRTHPDIDELQHEFLRLFSNLFSRLASEVQKQNPPRVDDMLDDLMKTFMTVSGQQGDKHEQIWLEGLGALKKLLKTLDSYDAIERVREVLMKCDGGKLGRYHIYSAFFELILHRYEAEFKLGCDVHGWELAASRLKEYTPAFMTSEFKSLANSFPSACREEASANVLGPSDLLRRISDVTCFADGHYHLSQAHEIATNIAHRAESMKSAQNKGLEPELNEALKFYTRAHELLIHVDRSSAGLAMAKLGQLRWQFLPKNERSTSIPFLREVLQFEKDVERDTWWLKQTKKYLAIYDEDQRLKEHERLKKEKERQKRREQQAREERKMAEGVRYQAMFNNLGKLKHRGEAVRSWGNLFAFLERLEEQYPPPDRNGQERLREYIANLRNDCAAQRICLRKIIRLYHPDKNGTQGDLWKDICAEVTKVMHYLMGLSIDLVLGAKSYM